MIKFELSSESKRLFDEMANRSSSKYFLRAAPLAIENQVVLGVLLQEAINQTMKAKLGNKWDHFKISHAGSNQYGAMVRIVPADDIGTYIYEGTVPHYITALPGYALEFPDENGQIIYREEVYHPGTKPLKDEMNKDMLEAVGKVILLYGHRV